LLLERRFKPGPSAAAVSNGIPSLVGRRLEVPGINWKSSRVNAVLFMSTQCHFCQASAPFYRELDLTRRASPAVSLLVLSGKPTDIVRKYLTSEHIAPDGIYTLRSIVSGLSGTPTMLLVDAGGIVRRSVVGQLTAAQQKEFLDALKAGMIDGA
jgi:hypothetical protein